MVQKYTQEVCLSSDKDYRLQGLLTKMQQQCFFTPLSDDQSNKMERLWQEVCAEEGMPEQPRTLQLKVGCGNSHVVAQKGQTPDSPDLARAAVVSMLTLLL